MTNTKLWLPILLSSMVPAISAAQGRVVDLAVSDETIETLIHRVLDANPPAPFSKTCATATNETCWLDHVDFANNTLQLSKSLQTDTVQMAPGSFVQVPRIFVSVPATFHWKSESCISDPNCPLGMTDQVEGPAPVFVRLSVQNGQLCGELAGVITPGSNLPNPVPPAQCTAVAVSLNGLSDDYAPAFSGLSTDDSEQQIVIRQEFQSVSYPNSFHAPSWQAFFDGVTSSPPADASVFIGKTLIADAIFDEFRQGVLSDPEIYYEPGADWLWSANGSSATVDMYVPITTSIVDGCAWGDIPADVYGTAVITLDAVKDELSIDIQASVGVHASYVGSCVLGPGVENILSSVSIAVVVTALNFEPETPVPDCTTVGPLHFVCKKSLPDDFVLPTAWAAPSQVGLDYVSMDATAAGLRLFMDTTIPPPINDGFNVTINHPVFGVHGHCSNTRIGYEGAFAVGGKTVVHSLTFGDTTGWVMSGEIPTAPPIWLALGANPEAYPNMPDLLATLRTSSGMQSFLVNAPTAATSQEKQTAALEAEGKILGCARWMEEEMLIYNPYWDIDPPHRGILRIVSRDQRVEFGRGMLVDLRVEVGDGAWLSGRLMLDTGADTLTPFAFRVRAMTADQAGRMDRGQIISHLERVGFASLISLSEDVIGIPDAFAALELGAPYMR